MAVLVNFKANALCLIIVWLWTQTLCRPLNIDSAHTVESRRLKISFAVVADKKEKFARRVYRKIPTITHAQKTAVTTRAEVMNRTSHMQTAF
jgi:hypothetical protein